MNIMLNGKAHVCDVNISLAQLIDSIGLAKQKVAVEINLDIIPRSQYGQYQLKENDQVEIVHAIGGG